MSGSTLTIEYDFSRYCRFYLSVYNEVNKMYELWFTFHGENCDVVGFNLHECDDFVFPQDAEKTIIHAPSDTQVCVASLWIVGSAEPEWIEIFGVELING